MAREIEIDKMKTLINSFILHDCKAIPVNLQEVNTEFAGQSISDHMQKE